MKKSLLHSQKPPPQKTKKQPRSWFGIMALSLGLLLGGSIVIKQDDEAFIKWLAGLFDEQTMIDNVITERHPPKDFFAAFELEDFEKTDSLFRKQMGLLNISPPSKGFQFYAADSYAMDKILLSKHVDRIDANYNSNSPENVYLPNSSYFYWIGKIRIPKTGVYNIHSTHSPFTQSRIFLDGYSVSYPDAPTFVYLKKGTYVLEKELEGAYHVLELAKAKKEPYFSQAIWANIEPIIGSRIDYQTESEHALSYQMTKLELANNTVAYYGHVTSSNQKNYEIQVQLPDEEREHIVFLNRNPPIDWVFNPKSKKLMLKPLIWVLNKGRGREPKAVVWTHQHTQLKKNGVETHSIALKRLPLKHYLHQWHHTELCPKNKSDTQAHMTLPCQPLENQKVVEDFYLLNDETLAITQDGMNVPFVGISLFSDKPTDILTLNQGITLSGGVQLPIPKERPKSQPKSQQDESQRPIHYLDMHEIMEAEVREAQKEYLDMIQLEQASGVK